MLRVVHLLLMAGLFAFPHLEADNIIFSDNYGTPTASIPAYYVGTCSGASCQASEGYSFTLVSNTIPATTYVGDSVGNVSDEIVATIGPPTSCSPTPACLTEFTSVQFTFTSGLDLTGSPVTCASVGGCDFTYDNTLQTVGAIIYGPGPFGPPAPGFSTTLQFQSLTGTLLSATLTNFDGGSAADPILLPSGEPVGAVTGTIGGNGTEDYYTFSWPGGFFSATASVSTTNTSASYLFSEGAAGNCGSGGSATLNSSDSFTGTISNPDLPAGQYCIGIDANSASDPAFALTFNTPVEGATPEPSTFGLLLAGLGMTGLLRPTTRRRFRSSARPQSLFR